MLWGIYKTKWCGLSTHRTVGEWFSIKHEDINGAYADLNDRGYYHYKLVPCDCAAEVREYEAKT